MQTLPIPHRNANELVDRSQSVMWNVVRGTDDVLFHWQSVLL